MGGVVTGSEIVTRESQEGRTLGVTVNGYCNLKCSHCYLPRDGPKKVIHSDLITLYGSAGYDRMVVVGMEPFVDKASKEATLALLDMAGKKGSSLGVMTNAIGLSQEDAKQLRTRGVSYIDVSMDGGPETYQKRRGVTFSKVEEGINNALRAGLIVHILHTLYRQNSTTSDIKDMLAVRRSLSLPEKSLILFSPFIPVADREAGEQELGDLLAILKTTSFMDAPKTHLMLDELNTRQFGGIDSPVIRSMIAEKGLEEKVHLASTQSTDRVLRVTWDGWAVHPLASVDVSKYNTNGVRVDSSSDLRKVHDILVQRASAGKE